MFFIKLPLTGFFNLKNFFLNYEFYFLEKICMIRVHVLLSVTLFIIFI